MEQQANDIFSALMEDEEEEDLEGPMVDWSQTTFTMDDVTIEVSQYNDEGDVSLSSTPKFASQFEDMPEDAKNILPSKIESENVKIVLLMMHNPSQMGTRTFSSLNRVRMTLSSRWRLMSRWMTTCPRRGGG